MQNAGQNNLSMNKADIIIIGAGAAGLMCAIEAGKRKRKVLVLEHANKPGKKILMSGGGRCNFTNYNVTPDNFISHNPHFSKSALSRYTQWDFIELVKKYHIPFHEKTLGQLFCDNKSKDILEMLLKECEQTGVEVCLQASVESIKKDGTHFKLKTSRGDYQSESVVIATGGLSIPTMGASPFGYKIAEQFGIKVWPTRAGLVPLTLHSADKERFSPLSGVSVNCVVGSRAENFHEALLFTHRGLSGPAILQISSYWNPGEEIIINLLPSLNLNEVLSDKKEQMLKSVLSKYIAKSILSTFIKSELLETPLKSLETKQLEEIIKKLQHWRIKPNGTEGYRTAEVTLGGVDCNAISSQTMEANNTPGLFFIGEVLDVTGWLGGYNFQWAWSSGWAAGQVA